MAVTSNTHIVGGSGQAGPYSYAFPILADTDVKVSVNAVIKTVTTHYTLDSSNTRITFTSGNHPSTGDKIIIYRDTDEDPINSTFVSGSTIRSTELNDNFSQLLYIAQETEDQAMSTLGGTMQADFTLGKSADLVFEGSTDDAHETTLTVTDPTADRTITLPNVTGTVVTTGDTGTVTSTMITDATIVNGDIANTTITGGKLVNDTITATQIAANAVTASELADDAVDRAAIVNDAVNGTKIADDSIDSEHYVDASIDLQHLATNSVNSSKIVDGTIVDADIANRTITGAKLVVDTISGNEIAANAIGASELADNSVDQNAIVNDAVNGTKIADSSIDSEHYVDGSIDHEHLANDIIDGDNIQDNAIGAEHLSANSVTTSEIADAELTTLAGMPSGTASILASSTALTATTAEINSVVDGKAPQTTISDDDTKYPTSGAVVDYVAAQIAPIGGLEVIATDAAFPNTQPSAGVVISIADAGGLVVNGSGVSTTGRTVGGSTVTISSINSQFNSTTVDAGVAFMVSSTGSGQNYTYHKATLKEADLLSLSGDINDFAERYRVSADPDNLPSKDEGDLVYDTAADKMKVYDSSTSAWKEVTSTGDFKYLVLTNQNTSNAATLTNTVFDLKENTIGGASASVTSAAQLLVSVNGVIQKANTGTSAPSEGFALSAGDEITFSSAPGTGASIFIIQFGSALSITTPGDNTVSTVKIQNGGVTEEKLSISNGPQNGYYLQTNGSGTLTWAAVAQYSTPLTTRGDILFRDASGDQRLAKGTEGQYLKIGANDPVWADVDSTKGGGAIYENSNTISVSHTLTANTNGMSAGPITVNSGITLTIPSGATYTVV